MIKNRHLTTTALWLASVLLTAGCMNPANGEAEDTKELQQTKNNPRPVESQVPTAMNMQEQASFATEHLMKKLNLGKSEISVLTIQSVTWRSSAIGCPKPGERYMQALVPGTLIVLAAGGKHYRYHAKRFAEPFYCEASRAQSPASENSEI
jgi:hypothetical protein